MPPSYASYGPINTILEAGGVGAWDRYLDNVEDVIAFNGMYFLYYRGYSTVRSDDGPGYRALGVATSPDGLVWTKHPGNPIVTFTPASTEEEEGVQSANVLVDGSTIHLYYGALRHAGGSAVDIEIRYRSSTDGLSFGNDTLIHEVSSQEVSPVGAYKDGSGNFHIYYCGNLANGVGDLKRLTGTTATNPTPNDTLLTTPDHFGNGQLIDNGDSTLSLTLVPDWGEASTYEISKSALGTLGDLLVGITFPNTRYGLPVQLQIDTQWHLYNVIVDSEEEPTGEGRIVMQSYPDVPRFVLAASANIAASAATSTTNQLTPPDGKDGGNFQAGRISDDSNPLPSLNLTSDVFTEIEFSIEGSEFAEPGVVYEFRVSHNGVALDTYTDTPEWTIEADPIEEAIGQATESDSVNALTKAKRKAIGLVTETETAQAITVDTALEESIGLTTETETAQDFSAGKRRAVGLNAETDSSLSLTTAKQKALGLNTETGSAHAVLSSKAKGLGQNAESQNAQAITARKARALGIATETGQALDLAGSKAKALGLTDETDLAHAVGAQGATLVGQATETSQAQPLTARKAQAIGQAGEMTSALGISAKKVMALGIASDEHSSQSLTGRKVRTLSLTTETDQAIGMETSRVLLQVVETDSGLPIRAIKTRQMGAAQETATGLAMGAWKHLSMGLVSESQAALALYIEPVYGNALQRTNEQLRIPLVQSERLDLPRIESEALAMPTITSESLIES